MSDTLRGFLIFVGVLAFFAYQSFSLYVANKTDPGLKEGIACIINQLSSHRQGDKQAHDEIAGAHDLMIDPTKLHGYALPPESDYDARVCEPFLREEKR